MRSVKSQALNDAAVLVSVTEALPAASRPHWPNAGATGFVLTDLEFRSVYANHAAVQILSYPREQVASWIPFIQERMRAILRVERFATDLPPTGFLSGRRRYVCRPFLLEAAERPAIVALVLERPVRDPLQQVGQRFKLSRRECETVQHLVQGLSTKEVAQRMGVSPNTIKQFVRLIMSKMHVTTRSGIVAKLIDS